MTLLVLTGIWIPTARAAIASHLQVHSLRSAHNLSTSAVYLGPRQMRSETLKLAVGSLLVGIHRARPKVSS
jgi:hypothetical protein